MTESDIRAPRATWRHAVAWLGRLMYSDNSWVIGALVLCAAQTFTGRHEMNPDGLSYVELAQTALRVGLHELVSAYWSPGYPALIAATFSLAKPGIATEFPVVHALNFLLFAVTVWIWRALLRSWATEQQSSDRWRSKQARSALTPLGFGIFLLVVLDSVGPSLVTPDLAVLATTLLIALCYQRLQTSGTWAAACSLGACCALGFWMKTVMFPLAAALFGLLAVFPPPIARARTKLLAASAVWLLAAFPLIALISAKLGRPSYGETGHLNYAWYVIDASKPEGPQADGPSLPHPPRVLLAKPRVIEFGSPIPGTFPLHYDPSYWSEGTVAHFALRAELRTLEANALTYAREWLSHYQAVVLTLIGLAAIYRVPRRRVGRTHRLDVLLVWSALGLALYAAVHVEQRLTAASFLLFVILLVRRLLQGTPRRAALGVTAILVGFVLLDAASLGSRVVGEFRHPRRPEYLELAKQLNSMGLKPATRIAIVGLTDGYKAEYAHAAGLVMAAEIDDGKDLATLTNADVEAVKTALARAGVRAIVRLGGGLDFAGADKHRVVIGDRTVADVLFTTP